MTIKLSHVTFTVSANEVYSYAGISYHHTNVNSFQSVQSYLLNSSHNSTFWTLLTETIEALGKSAKKRRDTSRNSLVVLATVQSWKSSVSEATSLSHVPGIKDRAVEVSLYLFKKIYKEQKRVADNTAFLRHM